MGERCIGSSSDDVRACLDYDHGNDVLDTIVFADRSQKLAIHAKRITVMDRDMRCLRDLWQTIDPESPIGYPSSLTNETHRRHDAEEHQRLNVQREKALMKARQYQRRNQPLPNKLAHFLKGWDITSGTRIRR